MAPELQHDAWSTHEEEMGRGGDRRRPQRFSSSSLPSARRSLRRRSRATPRHRRGGGDGGDRPRLQILALQLRPGANSSMHH